MSCAGIEPHDARKGEERIRLEEPCIITLRLYHYVGSNERENLNIATLIRECKGLGDIGRRRPRKSMISAMMELAMPLSVGGLRRFLERVVD
jgi:hypothetical protein